MPYPFVMDVDYRRLYIPKKIQPAKICFGEASITIHFHERGIPDDIPLDVLQDCVTSLWSDDE